MYVYITLINIYVLKAFIPTEESHLDHTVQVTKKVNHIF